MDDVLPPQAWRSEAFAEDLHDADSETTPAPRPRWASLLLGVLPVMLATVGTVAALWPHA